MQNYFLVFAGGGLGAVARYWLSGLVYARFGNVFPYGTLLVNIVGCFLIGLLMSLLEDRFLVDTEEKIKQFLPFIDDLFERTGCGGMVTIEKAEVIRYSVGKD